MLHGCRERKTAENPQSISQEYLSKGNRIRIFGFALDFGFTLDFRCTLDFPCAILNRNGIV
jgi:hypothetical protein